MKGKIYFYELSELATFLKAFTGSTATFEVKQDQPTKRWILEFLGGYCFTIRRPKSHATPNGGFTWSLGEMRIAVRNKVDFL
jgi:hypothetical protein